MSTRIKRLTNFKTLATPDERRSFGALLLRGLAQIGVAPGEEFLIAHPDALGVPDADQMAPFARQQDTSREAALAVYPRSGSKRREVLDLLAHGEPYGYTRDELCVQTQMPPNVVTPRVWELVKGGWVEDTARRRKTRAGEHANVLRLTEKGRHHYSL